jgi:hypothetical protein
LRAATSDTSCGFAQPCICRWSKRLDKLTHHILDAACTPTNCFGLNAGVLIELLVVGPWALPYYPAMLFALLFFL